MTLSQSDILADLTTIMKDLFENDSLLITPDTTAKDVPGWDSLSHVTLIVAAESKFKVKFRTSEIQSLLNVGHFTEVIEVKLRNRGN